MNKIIPTAAALALAFSLPHAAMAQNGHGQGGDHARQDKGGGRGAEARPEKGRSGGQDGAASERGRAAGQAARQTPPPARDAVRRPDSPGPGQGQGRSQGQGRDDDDRPGQSDLRTTTVVAAAGTPVTVFRVERDRGLIAGCPPGLAKRNNGCLPPGQERQIARARYDYLWRSRNDDWLYRYDDGYLYRVDRTGSVMGWLPVLGGALFPGAVWPTQYAYQPVPTYYAEYYRLSAPYDYRYANGALYGVDPRTQAITQVAALLTGQPITVGQPMPVGYDVYNVPYAYRSQYVDSPNGLYRYSDGYIYRVDPTTQLVQAAIQLLT
ncbi:hypothetical protein [Brevundimonas sp.]|uniref:hypothetical protein n=1 Tax=Brevundimonas sp. TaxID=1871086 RepID=UPI002D760E42|nr:hypothetical protein [Brevundimonas sp.]HYC99273.1 hypothetical protein [Brevundimonas sp.]